MPVVLIVDDHPDSCRPLARLLRASGHESNCVDSGPAALEFVRTHSTDLMILDVMMPGMSGFDVLRALRAQPQFRNLPVLMYSALADAERRDEAMRLGAQDYLVKGRIVFGDLEALVEKYAGKPS